MQQRQSTSQPSHNPRVSFQFGNQAPNRNSTKASVIQPNLSEMQPTNRLLSGSRQLTFGVDMTSTQRSQAMRFTFHQLLEQPPTSHTMPNNTAIQNSMEEIPLLDSKIKYPKLSKTQSHIQISAPQQAPKSSFWCCY